MSAFLDSLWYALPFVEPPPVARVIYPEGAYIPTPTVEPTAITGVVMEGMKMAKPVMDANLAKTHNESLFQGALSGVLRWDWPWWSSPCCGRAGRSPDRPRDLQLKDRATVQ